MYNATDVFGKEISAGDVIVYNVKGSTYITTRLAVVNEIIDRGEDVWKGDRIHIKVTAFQQNAWIWNNKTKKGENKDRIYHTTLTSNRNIIKLNGFTFPDRFKELLASVI